MRDTHTWQTRTVEHLSRLFKEEPDAKAFILTGSLADAEIEADVWSDIDAKVILDDESVDRYYLSVAWLHPFGQLVGVERHENQCTKTLRVCLDGFRRFDLVFVPESVLQNPSLRDCNLLSKPYAVVWSRLPSLEAQIASPPSPAEYQDISNAEIERIADHFWFKAAVAVSKVVRNDLLIGLHLTLDLTRDCLVLQMIRRDRKKRTRVHRTGGWGNELVARFSRNGQEGSPEEILDLIKLSCETFDELAVELSPSYSQRGPLLFPTIERARGVLQASQE